ncbi:MAG: hypothetical protein ACI8ZM_000109 [Crocinitomix sp.]|jgi:hypothetical protein
MIAKKYFKYALAACILSMSSCAYLLDSMIYSNKMQTCALIDPWGDTLCVYSECGGSYDEASDDCKVDAYDYNQNWNPQDYTCECSSEYID